MSREKLRVSSVWKRMARRKRGILSREKLRVDFTILRPAWFTRDEAIDYQITRTGEPFKGHEVSLNSLSDLIVKLTMTPGMESRRSLGVSKGGGG